MTPLNKAQRRKKRLAILAKRMLVKERHAEMLIQHRDHKAAKKISRDRKEKKKKEGEE